MITEEEQQNFFQLLVTFMSNDNEARTQAEASYDTIPANKKVLFLISMIRFEGNPEEIRSLASVLLRRLFDAHFEHAWTQLDEGMRGKVKEEIVSLISSGSGSLSLRKKLCEMTASFVRRQIDEEFKNSWPEFLAILFQLISSPHVILRENALLIVSYAPVIFGDVDNSPVLGGLKEIITEAMTMSQEGCGNIPTFGSLALAKFILMQGTNEGLCKLFSDVFPHYLKVMFKSCCEVDGDDELMQLTIELVSEAPKFVRPSLGALLSLLVQIVKNDNDALDISSEMKHLAIECYITAAESMPGAVKKVALDTVPVMVTLLLEMMTEVDDEGEDWITSDETVEEDSDSDPAIGESSLDRLACGLGGRTVLPLVLAHVQLLLSSDKWERRHGGLMALSAVGEGCSKEMENQLGPIVDALIQYLKDPNPRVRYAACNAIGQMATDFSPTFEKKFHSKVLPGLFTVLDDNSCARVQAHAGAALVNFCEECPRDILKNYAEILISKLESVFTLKLKELVETNKKLVLEQLLTTVASIANTLSNDFAPYYARFMPCIKYIMTNANAEELRLLRGKTIECASLIGLAVGAEQFTADAADIMDLLLRSQVDNGGIVIADDDPQLTYMITAWARICQILGDKFAPYLPMVMAPVLRTAAIAPEVAIMNNEEVGELQDDWEVIQCGEENVGLHTARIEDKAMACQMLVCYARIMKTHFRPFVDQVLEIIQPLFKFYFHDSVRSSAAELVPHLIESLEGDQAAQVMLWNVVRNSLFEAVEAEMEAEVKSEQMHALSAVIEILPREAIDGEIVARLTTLVERVYETHFEKSALRIETSKDEDYDDVVEQQLWDQMEEDNFLLTKASDILHAFLKTQGTGYLSYMEGKIIGYVAKLLAPDRHWQERQWALCVWDDLMEYGGPASVKYQHLFLPHMINYLSDESAEVRQAAAYGCGLMAQFCGTAYSEACTRVIPLLVQLISDVCAREEDDITATENAISSFGKIIKYCPSAVNIDEAIPLWLSWLPIWEDKDEFSNVYGFFCELLEGDHPAAIGANGANLPHILRILAETFYRDAIGQDFPLRPRLIQLVHKIRANEALHNYCFAQLNPELQGALLKIP